METGNAGPVAIHYKRGLVLVGAWLGLGLTTAFVIAYVVFTVQFLEEDAAVIIGMWAVMAFVLLSVVAVTIPLIKRFSSKEPAIIVSTEGIRTRDMSAVLSWDAIETLRTRDVTSWAGKYTTTVNMFEICPKDRVPPPFNWLKLIDGHANPLRVAWHLLAPPEQLRAALDVHAPPDLLAKSDLARLPGSATGL